MSDEDWLNSTKSPSESEIAIDYIKAPDFRVVWADGLVGSATPNGLIHFALYAERPAIPRRQVFAIEKIAPNVGKLGAEVREKQISRGSMVREMSIDVFVSAQTAESLGNWLLQRAGELRKTNGEKA